MYIQSYSQEDGDFWAKHNVTNLHCKEFQETAKQYTMDMIAKDLLPTVGNWRWLELDCLRFYRFEDCVEFMTSKQTFQINLVKVEETA
jgi:hypothetical protein|tara:strand:- start:407 stop:670 length:264 start_codon:yes stop_codon:yes gene_type:complete